VNVCAAACTTDDVVDGLAQLSMQLQGLSTYIALATGLAVFALFVVAILAFVQLRVGPRG
jgi:hypothetical protein